MCKNCDLVNRCAKIVIWLPNVQKSGFGYQMCKKRDFVTRCAKSRIWLPDVQKAGFGYQMCKNCDLVAKCQENMRGQRGTLPVMGL